MLAQWNSSLHFFSPLGSFLLELSYHTTKNPVQAEERPHEGKQDSGQ